MISADVILGDNVVIHHPQLVNLYGCRIGEATRIGAFVEIQRGAVVGRFCKISSHSFICDGVTLEDGVFVGSRAVIVEGMLVEREAVIGAGVVLTSSTTIIDVTGPDPVELRGRVPARSVVIPGTRIKAFAAGEYGVPCALIIGERTASTDRKVSLNAALRDFSVPV